MSRKKSRSNTPQLFYRSKLVKLADKICNLRNIITAPPEGWSTERKQNILNGLQK
jgi:guanosine-3',5'-bis(diphosphate) 3'-pyrophosphohydrolase